MVSCLPVAHGVAFKDSKTTPQEESNIKVLPPSEPLKRFFGFHLDLSFQIEVLTVMPSTRKMIPTGTIITDTCKAFTREPTYQQAKHGERQAGPRRETASRGKPPCVSNQSEDTSSILSSVKKRNSACDESRT